MGFSFPINIAQDERKGAINRAPAVFMDGAMYFGQDRLDFIEETLQAPYQRYFAQSSSPVVITR